MKRILLAAVLVLLPALARAQSEEQALVDRSTLALQEMMTQSVSQNPRNLLQRTRAVLVCPRIFKAGFIFAGSGGDCVLLARAGNGTWSYPAFYTIGSVSVGFQIGLQDSALVMMVMNEHSLGGILGSHFKLGADASLAVGTIGGGVEGAMTTEVGADLIAFSSARGAFAGVSLQGSVLNGRIGMNQAYYGQPLGARQIVVAMQGANPGADPLRAVLTRFGSASTATAFAAPPYPPAGPGSPPPAAYPPPTAQAYPPAYPPPTGLAPTAPGAGAPIEQQNLPPPPR